VDVVGRHVDRESNAVSLELLDPGLHLPIEAE
jgi:hypothetical protein